MCKSFSSCSYFQDNERIWFSCWVSPGELLGSSFDPQAEWGPQKQFIWPPLTPPFWQLSSHAYIVSALKCDGMMWVLIQCEWSAFMAMAPGSGNKVDMLQQEPWCFLPLQLIIRIGMCCCSGGKMAWLFKMSFICPWVFVWKSKMDESNWGSHNFSVSEMQF